MIERRYLVATSGRDLTNERVVMTSSRKFDLVLRGVYQDRKSCLLRDQKEFRR